jgi:hypothetical protein
VWVVDTKNLHNYSADKCDPESEAQTTKPTTTIQLKTTKKATQDQPPKTDLKVDEFVLVLPSLTEALTDSNGSIISPLRSHNIS